MNLTELKTLVDILHSRSRNPEEINVVVKIERLNTMGGTPTTVVKNIHNGFDFDNRKLIITTEDMVRVVNEDELSKLKEDLRKIGWTAYEFNNLKRENKRLRKLLDEQ